MSYDQMTLLELKTLCKDRGLKVSGNKNEVVIRLMEHDESLGGTQPTTFGTNVANMAGSMPVAPQIVYGKMTSQGIVINASTGTTSTVGTVIIMYGIFRMFWALGFAAFGDGSLGWLLAPIAFIVASMFIFSGILLTQGYRNGINTTIATFIISGSLSIIFTGETLNPVSVSLADGGMMIPFSMMCTLLGIGVAAIPLLLTDEELKTGWPPAIERLLNKQNPAKVEINCSHCGSPLLVPRDYSGKISCPQCGKQSTV
ncbi:MAG: SAP domain-containing protein [Candidatus Thermoplasmatota archaeon]|nr:SAP domain-containing protein [Candidatus Thermoplasmatota archaeon]